MAHQEADAALFLGHELGTQTSHEAIGGLAGEELIPKAAGGLPIVHAVVLADAGELSGQLDGSVEPAELIDEAKLLGLRPQPYATLTNLVDPR